MLYEQFERLFIEKCAGCLPFGLRACALLRASSTSTTAASSGADGIFKIVLAGGGSSNQQQQQQQQLKLDRLRQLQQHIETVTAQGLHLPPPTSYLRSMYYRDVTFMLDSLARLGIELKAYPAAGTLLYTIISYFIYNREI